MADVEVLNDQPNARALNLFGRSFGTTTMTFWDADGKAVTFLIRVTIDTIDLESRLTQLFPGQRMQVAALQLDLACNNAAGRRGDQPHDGQRRHALAAA